MYQGYQDFRQALNKFMAEDVNPEIIRFVKMRQTEIGEYFETVTRPFDAMLADAHTESNRIMKDLGVSFDFDKLPAKAKVRKRKHRLFVIKQ